MRSSKKSREAKEGMRPRQSLEKDQLSSVKSKSPRVQEVNAEEDSLELEGFAECRMSAVGRRRSAALLAWIASPPAGRPATGPLLNARRCGGVVGGAATSSPTSSPKSPRCSVTDRRPMRPRCRCESIAIKPKRGRALPRSLRLLQLHINHHLFVTQGNFPRELL